MRTIVRRVNQAYQNLKNEDKLWEGDMEFVGNKVDKIFIKEKETLVGKDGNEGFFLEGKEYKVLSVYLELQKADWGISAQTIQVIFVS